MPISNGIDSRFYAVAIHQIDAIRRTIDLDDDFFNTFFLQKTRDEVMNWLENEAYKWE